MTETNRYVRPGFFTRHLMNPLVAVLTRLGFSVKGSHVLAVRGRSSGEWRTVPVNPLDLDGHRYLVAPRGNTEWVKNIRVAGGGELRLGHKVQPIHVTELTDAEKPPVIREYLRRWKWEVGTFFEGLDETATDEQILAVAPGFPVFAVA
jgi:deazaflavin-dependent oxidoreductase (nitroreductase family)